MFNKYSGLKVIVLAAGLALVSVIGLQSEDAQPNPQTNANLTAEQKNQLTRLNQLEEQLQKSRDALHAAINQYGWESDEADVAREKLIADRTEYRNLRRLLRGSGVAVPPPSGFGAGGPDGQPGQGARRWQGPHHGYHHGGRCGCDCGGW
jgi:hypothetical protein